MWSLGFVLFNEHLRKGRSCFLERHQIEIEVTAYSCMVCTVINLYIHIYIYMYIYIYIYIYTYMHNYSVLFLSQIFRFFLPPYHY